MQTKDEALKVLDDLGYVPGFHSTRGMEANVVEVIKRACLTLAMLGVTEIAQAVAKARAKAKAKRSARSGRPRCADDMKPRRKAKQQKDADNG